VARAESGKGVGCLIVMSEDVMKFKAIEFLLEPSYLLTMGCHAWVTTIQLPHDLVDNDLRLTMDVKPLDTELSSDV
jgi:hypothetical protein